jgi:nicotinate-nucleotide pyrophosphorylase (carboxylating)
MDEIDQFLKEDLGEGDVTSNALFTNEEGKGYIYLKESAVLAGLLEARLVFERVGCKVKLLKKEGSKAKKGAKVLEVSGLVRSILGAERLALNFLARMSGITTQTRQMFEKCKRVNPRVTLAGTRKTTPGFRRWEKRAIVLGGGEPHRMGLWDAVLIKDNHLAAIGSVEEAVKRAKEKVKDKPIEIEVANLKDAELAAKLGVDAIMLDNLPPSKGKKIAEALRKINPKILIEVSGGINQKNITKYASYPDRISCGCLTHSVKAIDFSLEIKRVSLLKRFGSSKAKT